MTGTLELADRPAFQLTMIMVKRNHTPPTLGAKAFAAELASGEITKDAARCRVKNMMTGSWPARPAHIKAIARALGVDPAAFYLTPAQAKKLGIP